MAEALSWEQMPGTSGGEEDPKRPPALHAFFLGHPEYADPAHREALAGEACGMDNTEAAHAWLKNPPPRTPLILEVTSESWKVFVAHSSHHCTSDDWAYYTSEANTAASQRGADVGYADPTNDAVVVRLHGQELARIPLQDTGFLMARAGVAPKEERKGSMNGLSVSAPRERTLWRAPSASPATPRRPRTAIGPVDFSSPVRMRVNVAVGPLTMVRMAIGCYQCRHSQPFTSKTL